MCDALPVELIGMNARMMTQVGAAAHQCCASARSCRARVCARPAARRRQPELPLPAAFPVKDPRHARARTRTHPCTQHMQYIEFVADRLLVALGNPKHYSAQVGAGGRGGVGQGGAGRRLPPGPPPFPGHATLWGIGPHAAVAAQRSQGCP